MDTGFGSQKPWSLSYSPTSIVSLAGYESPCTSAGAKKPKFKGSRDKKHQGAKDQESNTCGQRGRVAGMPITAEPAAVTIPPAATPVEATDNEVATGVAVDSAPEENIFAFPFFRDKLGVSQ